MGQSKEKKEKKFQTTNNICQSLPGCGVVVHKHCENRCPPCKALIESGSYVTMSRKKIVKALDDLDDLAQFLLDKISMLNRDGSTGSSKVDRVFETALLELHHSLVSNYSLTLQVYRAIIIIIIIIIIVFF